MIQIRFKVQIIPMTIIHQWAYHDWTLNIDIPSLSRYGVEMTSKKMWNLKLDEIEMQGLGAARRMLDGESLAWTPIPTIKTVKNSLPQFFLVGLLKLTQPNWKCKSQHEINFFFFGIKGGNT